MTDKPSAEAMKAMHDVWNEAISSPGAYVEVDWKKGAKIIDALRASDAERIRVLEAKIAEAERDKGDTALAAYMMAHADDNERARKDAERIRVLTEALEIAKRLCIHFCDMDGYDYNFYGESKIIDAALAAAEGGRR